MFVFLAFLINLLQTAECFKMSSQSAYNSARTFKNILGKSTATHPAFLITVYMELTVYQAAIRPASFPSDRQVAVGALISLAVSVRQHQRNIVIANIGPCSRWGSQSNFQIELTHSCKRMFSF